MAFLDPVVEGYGRLFEDHFTQRRSLVGAAFLRQAVSGAPAIAARLIPVLSGLIAGGRIPKVFRLHEAVLLLSTMIRSASAPWAAGLPCSVAPTVPPSVPRARGKKAPRASAEDAPAAAVPPTVSASLASAIPAVLRAVAAVISSTAGGGNASVLATLPVKQAKDAVAILPQLFKAGLLRSDSSADPDVDATFQALAALLTRFGGRHGVGQQVGRCFELVGREAPDIPETSGAVPMEEVVSEEKALPATEASDLLPSEVPVAAETVADIRVPKKKKVKAQLTTTEGL